MNKNLFKLHSWLALVCFLPLLLVCVTGSILVFKHEIDRALMHDTVRVSEVGNERRSMDALLDNINAAHPNYEAVGWALFQDQGRADLVYLMARGSSDWSYTLIDQYSGNLLSPVVSTTHYLTDWLLELHFTLLLHDAGLVLSALLALVLCLLGITGLVLHRKFWKNLFTLRRKARLIVYFSDLHKLTGVIASPVLLVLGITGGYWNISEFVHELEEHAGGAEHYRMAERLYGKEVSFQALHEDAATRIEGFEPTYFSLPWEPGRDITVFGDVPTANALLSQYASTVSYDAQSGELKNAVDIREAGLGAKTLDSFRRLHFGDFAGLPSRILWCVVGLSPLLLAVTGLTIWFQRRKKRRKVAARRALVANASGI